MDSDSALGEDMPQSSTTSLNSAVTTFRDFRGRRYHAFEDAGYWLPNDDAEINRLDLQHFIWKIFLNGRLNIAPIPKDLHRALDVGTGTGKWAIEFADDHPSCQIIGTDLSPIQPSVVPNNCTFVTDNIEEPWVFNEPFDYIHSRVLCLGTAFLALGTEF
jgi:SAM-dependent methyltransferase